MAYIIGIETLDISLAEQSYAAPAKNKAVTGEALSVASRLFENGLGVHARSQIKIRLNEAYSFSAMIGVTDSNINCREEDITGIPLADGKRIFYRVGPGGFKQFVGVEGEDGVDAGRVIFRLIHNGKELYNSGIMQQGDRPKEIELELAGGILEMLVDDAGAGNKSGACAAWLKPIIKYKEIAPVIVPSDYTEKQTQASETSLALQKAARALPSVQLPLAKPSCDWLIDNSAAKAKVYSANDGMDIVLSNGLIARVFRLVPNLATIDYINQMTGESMLRAVSEEGTLTIDGVSYSVGGLSGQNEYAYTLMSWLDLLTVQSRSFVLQDFEVKEIDDRMDWKRVRWASNKQMPTGKELVFNLVRQDILAKVHFAMYDGIPTLSKWIEVINKGNSPIQLDAFKLERLAMVEGENLIASPEHWEKPDIHIETDYAFGGMFHKTSDHTSYWERDPCYTSQLNYSLETPCLLEVRPPSGPGVSLGTNEKLTTFRVWETPMDTREKERQGLFIRKVYRTISPWITENPIFMHLISSDENKVKEAIDQCAEVGYEMVILSFGSGVDLEDESAENYQKLQNLREYASQKGIELGGYSLLSSRWISDEVDVINPETGKRGGMIFGSSPCLCSQWGEDYIQKIKAVYEQTGMMVFENDGSYPGNVCASTTHAYHNGLEDSQWKQYAQIQGLYKWMRAKGIYMNIPDFYVHSGANKVGIGYREVNWSLPRARQLLLGRINIYDGLWNRPPSMSWTFSPLTEYHGGGAAATIEPLHEHLQDYVNQMIQNYGSGVQATYRGKRLYDSEKTKLAVIEIITWYKKYREILNSDIIHLRRPSGKDWDGFMHVNPDLEVKGFAMLFNPTDNDMLRKIDLPLYYTGLKESAYVYEQDEVKKHYQLNRDYTVTLPITIPANSYKCLLIE